MRQLATLILAAAFACAPNGQPPDAPPAPPPPQGPAVQLWLTTASGAKLLSPETDVHFDSAPPPATLLRIVVDEGTTYQEMVGFGAAITDASAWLIQNRLTAAQRGALFHDLVCAHPGVGLKLPLQTLGASDVPRHHDRDADMPSGR